MNTPVSPSTNSPDLPDLPCYLNGVYSSVQDAKVSVLDRGFIFGDGVYEVIPIYNGQPFRLAHHMARLDRSLAELRIPNPLTHSEWAAVATELVARYAKSIDAKPEDCPQIVYIQITRGVAPRDHVMPKQITPTVFVMSSAMPLPSATQRAEGVACVTANDFRWEKAHIKSISLLGAVFSRQISADAGALETIMFRGDHLSEAAASNVWIVKDGQVFGPTKNNLVLEGIRYGLFAELCEAQGIPFTLRTITRAEVLAADEVLLSSATKEVLAVTQLDNQPVGHDSNKGRPGPVYAKLYAAYQAALPQAPATP